MLRFAVGRRTNKTLSTVLCSLLLADAQIIYTDRLKHYHYLIPKHIHNTTFRTTNHMERMHLNLRIHLKRLQRRGICYSRNKAMLNAVIKIYFWG